MEDKKLEWESFVRRAKMKTGNHTTMVRFYNAVYNSMIMSVILLAAVLTCLILLGGMSVAILASISGACTILTALSKFLIADRKKAGHKRYAKIFQDLLIRMLKCQTIPEYNVLWSELHESIIKEPLVLIWQRKSKKIKIVYSVPPRLLKAFEGKEEDPRPNQAMVQHGHHGGQQGYGGAYQGYNGTQEGYSGTYQGYNGSQQAHVHQGPRMAASIRAENEFNPHDFHVMSMDDQASNPQLEDEKQPFVPSSPRKGKKKKNSDKSKQYGASSSQGTLDGINEENEFEEQNNQDETSTLTKLKKKGKKKGQSKFTSPEDLPLPPPFDGEDGYDDKEEQKPGKLFGKRGVTGKKDRPTYHEEEEDEISEDSDDLDDDMEQYTRS